MHYFQMDETKGLNKISPVSQQLKSEMCRSWSPTRISLKKNRTYVWSRQDAEIKDSDIKDIYRIKPHGKSNGTGTIVAEFSTVLKKEKVLTATKTMNKGREV